MIKLEETKRALLKIEDIQRLEVRPGEMLLISVPGPLSMADAERIRTIFRENLPDGVKVIVKPAEINVEVVTAVTEA